MNFAHAHNRYMDAVSHEPTGPRAASNELMGVYSMPESDADEWMVATATYYVDCGELEIHGKAWNGLINRRLEAHEVDTLCGFDWATAQYADEVDVDLMLAAFHESALPVAQRTASAIESQIAGLEGALHVGMCEEKAATIVRVIHGLRAELEAMH